jgi:hypothetical protein
VLFAGCVGGPQGGEPGLPAVSAPVAAAAPDPLALRAEAALAQIAGAAAPDALPRDALIAGLVEAAGSGADAARVRAEATRLVDDAIAAVRRVGPAHASAMQAQAVRGVAGQFAARVRGAPGAPAVVNVPGGAGKSVDWATLGGFPYVEGAELPAAVQALDDQRVSLRGALLPLEEVDGEVWYLLVESLWDCCFGKAPELHQAVVVRLRGLPHHSGAPVQVTGQLSVGEDRDADGYVSSVYRLEAAQVVLLP